MSIFTYIITWISVIVIATIAGNCAYWMFAADEVEYRLLWLLGFVLCGICITAFILLLVTIYNLGGL